MSEGMILGITLVIGITIAIILITTLVVAIQRERRSAGLTRVWSNFGLSIAFLALFLISWIAQAVAEWGTFVQEEQAHGDTPEHPGLLRAVRSVDVRELAVGVPAALLVRRVLRDLDPPR